MEPVATPQVSLLRRLLDVCASLESDDPYTVGAVEAAVGIVRALEEETPLFVSASEGVVASLQALRQQAMQRGCPIVSVQLDIVLDILLNRAGIKE